MYFIDVSPGGVIGIAGVLAVEEIIVESLRNGATPIYLKENV